MGSCARYCVMFTVCINAGGGFVDNVYESGEKEREKHILSIRSIDRKTIPCRNT